MKPMNILFIFSDQQRWDTLGCYGQKLPVSPHLDQMAQRGTQFNYAYTCQPVCGPARACLQTGEYPTQTGCFTNGRMMPLDRKNLADYFHEAGYETAYIGKWHLASTSDDLSADGIGTHYEKTAIPDPYRGGYRDYWIASDVLEFTSHGYDGHLFDQDNQRVDFTGYRADAITDFALDYLRQPKDKPFFLFISYIEPHHQNDRNRYEGPDGSKEKFKDFEVPEDLDGRDGNYMQEYPDYLGCCHSLDMNVGRIVEYLSKQNILDDTLIIYTSDHGSHFQTRNGEYKRSCHESCTHIPMIAQGGVFNHVGKVDQLVSLMDIPITLLTAAGIDPPPNMQGIPLQKLAGQPDIPIHHEVFMQISESQVGRAIRTRQWKYSVEALDKDAWHDAGSDTYTETFLYDLENDPHETNNLVNDPKYANVRKQLADQLVQRMVMAGEDIPSILPAL